MQTINWNEKLLEAARSGAFKKEIEALLHAGADANCKDGKGNTPLHLATGHEASKYTQKLEARPGVIECLLTAGASLTAKNNEGLTPFLAAAKYGCPGIHTLVNAGADVTQIDDQGQNAWQLASRIPSGLYPGNYRYTDIEHIRMGAVNCYFDFIAAVQKGDIAKIKQYEKHGTYLQHSIAGQRINIHVSNGNRRTYSLSPVEGMEGSTMLHWAVFGNHLEVVKILLKMMYEQDQPLDRTNANGKTALDLAADKPAIAALISEQQKRMDEDKKLLMDQQTTSEKILHQQLAEYQAEISKLKQDWSSEKAQWQQQQKAQQEKQAQLQSEWETKQLLVETQMAAEKNLLAEQQEQMKQNNLQLKEQLEQLLKQQNQLKNEKEINLTKQQQEISQKIAALQQKEIELQKQEQHLNQQSNALTEQERYIQLNLQQQKMEKSQEQIDLAHEQNQQLQAYITELEKQLAEMKIRHEQQVETTKQQATQLNEQQETITQQLTNIPNAVKEAGLRDVVISELTQHFLELGLDEVAKLAHKQPSCFISYAWGIKEHEQLVKRIVQELKRAKIKMRYDLEHNVPGTQISRFTEEIESCDVVIPVGSTQLMKRYKEVSVVSTEMHQIYDKFKNNINTPEDELSKTPAVIPIILNGTKEQALPSILRDTVYVDFQHPDKHAHSIFELLKALLPAHKEAIATIADDFEKDLAAALQDETLIQQQIKEKLELEQQLLATRQNRAREKASSLYSTKQQSLQRLQAQDPNNNNPSDLFEASIAPGSAANIQTFKAAPVGTTAPTQTSQNNDDSSLKI